MAMWTFELSKRGGVKSALLLIKNANYVSLEIILEYIRSQISESGF